MELGTCDLDETAAAQKETNPLVAALYVIAAQLSRLNDNLEAVTSENLSGNDDYIRVKSV